MHPLAWAMIRPWHWKSLSKLYVLYVDISNYPSALSRPESSFNPLTHPFKSAHMLLWNPLRRYFIKFCVVVVCSVTVISLAINLPGKLVEIPLE